MSDVALLLFFDFSLVYLGDSLNHLLVVKIVSNYKLIINKDIWEMAETKAFSDMLKDESLSSQFDLHKIETDSKGT